MSVMRAAVRCVDKARKRNPAEALNTVKKRGASHLTGARFVRTQIDALFGLRSAKHIHRHHTAAERYKKSWQRRDDRPDPER